MAETKTMILEHQSIITKMDRMACEICEKHTESSQLIICGLNSRGFFLATELSRRINTILPELQTALVQITTQNTETPLYSPVTDFKGKHVLVVDDVINTGATLMMVLQQIFASSPQSIETAFLAKREHRSFPVKADYVGISLATTLLEHVQFDNSNPDSLIVYLN